MRRIFLKTNKQKKQCIEESVSIITYDPLEVCGGVCICRDPALCLYFLIFAVFGTFLVTGVGLYKNVATSGQIASTWDHQNRVCALSRQPTNPTFCAFKNETCMFKMFLSVLLIQSDAEKR